jgi:hypothetical protein
VPGQSLAPNYHLSYFLLNYSEAVNAECPFYLVPDDKENALFNESEAEVRIARYNLI